jgi:hypothetical protein
MPPFIDHVSASALAASMDGPPQTAHRVVMRRRIRGARRASARWNDVLIQRARSSPDEKCGYRQRERGSLRGAIGSIDSPPQALGRFPF